MILLAFLGIMVLIGVVLHVIERKKEAEKQKVLSTIAQEVLGNFNIQKEREDFLTRARTFSPATIKCPLCSGVLVERNGVRGLFKGCSRYPLCRYTTN